MPSYIIATKKHQSQTFSIDGMRVPTTHLNVEDNFVLCIKNKVSDGYSAVQIGMKSSKSLSKPVAGLAKKAGVDGNIGKIFEFRVDHYSTQPNFTQIEGKDSLEIEGKRYTVGEKLNLLDLLSEGDVVDVTAISRAKGFQGVMKRHGFAGGPRTHGQSDRERAPGSMGSGTTPGRIYKGKKLAGRMGGEQRTVKNLIVLRVEDKTIVLKGLIPGGKNRIVRIKKTSKSC